MWQSKRVRRVVKSVMAAETLALVDGSESALWLKQMVMHMCPGNLDIKIYCYTDSHQLYDAIHSTKAVSDKRLRIDIHILQKMKNVGDVCEFEWIQNKDQLADIFTKSGVSPYNLFEVLDKNVIKFSYCDQNFPI